MTFSTTTFSLEDSETYRMPAEWEPHQATWLTWPHDEAHWPGKFEKIPAIWARMVKELESGEEVHINIHDDKTRHVAESALEKVGSSGKNVHFHSIRNQFSWARDHGPIFVRDKNNKVVITNWKYNAWGEKWPFEVDDQIPSHIAKILNLPEIKIPMVLEGGSIDVNGDGVLLTTKSCLLNKNRNPDFSKQKIEDYLSKVLGVKKILWLGDGIEGDDTDGHVDDLTRFVNKNTILTVVEKNKSDVNYKALSENLKSLQSMADHNQKSFEIIEVQMPEPVIHEDVRLPASYANFYIGNKVILLPVFEMKSDQQAVDALSKLFPDRKIAAIPSRDLVWGLGAFHCVTQQQPF